MLFNTTYWLAMVILETYVQYCGFLTFPVIVQLIVAENAITVKTNDSHLERIDQLAKGLTIVLNICNLMLCEKSQGTNSNYCEST